MRSSITKLVDPRIFLSIPFIYRGFVKVVGAQRWMEHFVINEMRPEPGCRILDIGCGPAQILDYLYDVEYVGLDADLAYIESARKRYRGRAIFLHQDVNALEEIGTGAFDIVLAYGVFHHLNDREVQQMTFVVKKLLKSQGRMLTVDPCFTSYQSWYERFVTSLDRGSFVRNDEEYAFLVKKVFSNVKVSVRRGAMPLPFSNIIIEATS